MPFREYSNSYNQKNRTSSAICKQCIDRSQLDMTMLCNPFKLVKKNKGLQVIASSDGKESPGGFAGVLPQRYYSPDMKGLSLLYPRSGLTLEKMD